MTSPRSSSFPEASRQRPGGALMLLLRALIAVSGAVALLACSTPDRSDSTSTEAPTPHASISPGNIPAAAPRPVASFAAAPTCQPACSSLERCEGGSCRPNCPKGEVFVPRTPPEGFTMGNGKPGEFNQKHSVVLTRPFCMDETEVTVAAYRSCVERGQCTKPEWRDVNSRSEEHTSELQSRENLVCRLLLEKKKNTLAQ